MQADLPLGALISILHRNHIAVLNRRLKPVGLTAAELPIIFHLSRREGVPQEALARHFHLDKATIARRVQRLVGDGFVLRRVNPGDRRAYGLFLTPRGREIVGEVLDIETLWERELLSPLAQEERDLAVRILRTMAEHSMRIAGMVTADETR